MEMKQSHLFILLVALFVAFSLVFAGNEVSDENNYVKHAHYQPQSVKVDGAVSEVDQGGSGPFFGGGGLGGRRRCFRCWYRGGYCCGFRCCTAEEYDEYIKAQGVPLH